jgi:hypothetical protein
MNFYEMYKLIEIESNEWEKILSNFPPLLQKEIRIERPKPDKDNIEWIKSWNLKHPTPINISLRALLQNPKNLLMITSPVRGMSRTPADVVEEINKKWGLSLKPGELYDVENSGRFRRYASMQSHTADPSVCVVFGIGRFIAALLRGDETLKVWDIQAIF